MLSSTSLFDDLDFFAPFDEEDRAVLVEALDLITLPERGVLFEAGQPGDALFVIRSGSIELSIVDDAGQHIVLDRLEPGEFFGELSLLDGGPRSATALAVEPTELIELDRDDLLFLFRKRPETALDVLAKIGKMTRKADALLRKRVSRNANEEMEEHLTALERVADWIAWFSGSMYFLTLNAVWFFVWIGVNVLDIGIPQFDPFPFGLLTMIVSLEAIFLSIFVLISQNRQAEKDHIRSDIEYEVNIKAELEVAHLHEKTDRLYEAMLARFAELERTLGGGTSPSPKQSS
jgi:uncharacterized membrane protein